MGRRQFGAADEVRYGRTVTHETVGGQGRLGTRGRLRQLPQLTRTRNKRRHRCSMPFRIERSAARTQPVASVDDPRPFSEFKAAAKRCHFRYCLVTRPVLTAFFFKNLGDTERGGRSTNVNDATGLHPTTCYLPVAKPSELCAAHTTSREDNRRT